MAKHGHNGNGHDPRHATETPDVSHIKNVDVTHEVSDVSVGGILKFVVGLTVFAAMVHILMWGLFVFFNSREEGKEPKAGPMAMTEQERRPPDPKLQAAPGFGVKLENGEWVPLDKREPQAEYRALRQQWQINLEEGAKDQSGRVVGLPIERAMEQFVQSHPNTRVSAAPAEGTGSRAEDYGVDMPTAASSGRTTEKRRQ
jgi:hypothetical protein